MSYSLRFHELALQEWKKLSEDIREQLKKKLAERLNQPRIPASALSGMRDCYKIKLHSTGYRLIYRVEEDIIYVTVIAIGKRERLHASSKAMQRLQEQDCNSQDGQRW